MGKKIPSKVTSLEAAKLLVGTYYSLQKERIQTGNRISALVRDDIVPESDAEYLHDFMADKLMSAEEEIRSEMARWVRERPIWNYFLEDVKGVGPVIAAGIIASIGSESEKYGKSIERFDTISSLWAYAGLHTYEVDAKSGKRWFTSEYAAREFIKPFAQQYVDRSDKKTDVEAEITRLLKGYCWGDDITVERVAAKRKAGQIANWNSFLKTLCWKIGESFVRCGGRYRDIFDDAKHADTIKHPDYSKGHIHARAKRKATKIFLSHLWEKWREMEGLPVREPYVIEKLGHTSKIQP